MSSVTAAPPPLPIETPPVAAVSERERFIDGRLHETRRRVKWVDLATGFATLTLGVLAYLFVAALADHWLISGGLGFFTRLLLWLLLLAAACTYAIKKLLPPLLHRVSPIYAAITIEHSQPAMRNSLINFLLLRPRRQEVAAPVLQALEFRAAADLSRARIDLSIDRTRLVRLCCAVAAVVAVFSIYQAASPKSPLRSAGRVLWPWTAAAAPTRVTISDVRPGDATVLHGDSLMVSAEITGLADGEVPELVYGTADGQVVAQAIAMNLPPGDYHYRCTLPPGTAGLQQDCTYFLRAGDCRTREYRVLTRTPPAISIEKVELRFPEYTGLPPQSIARQGDLRAIEGAEATIHAEANTEIKPDSAEIDLGCTGLRGVSMESSGRKAVGRFTIRPREDDPARPRHDCYQLRFSDREGKDNPRPARHRIEMLRDMPPEVRIVEPRQPMTPLAENGRLTIRLRAEDPDFGLRRVVLRAECDDRGLLIPPLLEKRKPLPAVPGEFAAEYVLEPSRFGLKAGQKVEFWAEAEDNKEPAANRAATAKQTIEILPPEKQDQQQSGNKQDQRDGKQEQQDKQPQDKPQDNQPGQGQQDNNNQGQQDKSNQGQQDQKGQQDKSGQGQQDESGQGQQDKSNQGQQGQQDKSGQGQQDKSSQDKSGQDQQAKSGQDKSGQGQQEKSGQEKSQGADQQGAKGQQGQQGQQGQPGEQQPQDGAQQGDQRDGQSGRGEGGQSGPGGEPQRIDPEAAPGDAMQEILNDMQRQESTGKKPDAGQDQSGPKDGSQAGEQSAQPGEGEQTEKQSPASGSKPEERRDSPGQGEQTGKPAGSPQPQEEGQPRDKKPEGTGQAPGEQKDEQAQSPGIDKHQSDSKGDTSGDRRGGGEQGGGQHAEKPGIGSAGENTPADQGASKAQEPGEGETGSRAGKDAQADKPAGSDTKTPVPAGKGTDSRPGEKGDSSGGETKSDQSAAGEQKDQQSTPDDAKQQPRAPQGRPADGLTQKPTQPSAAQGALPDQGSPDKNDKSSQGATAGPGAADGKSDGERAPLGGGKAGTPADGKPTDMAESPADQANLDYARRQTALALEHLRDQLAKEKPELLDRLGWTKDETRRFIERWEAMSRAAAQPTPAGKAARRELDEALRSLGLRPGGTQLRRGGVAEEKPDGVRDAGRFAPPPQWAEQFRAYTRGVAGQRNGDAAEQPAPAEPRKQP